VQLILPQEEGGFGFDAMWADDFHHVVRVINTHEDEGYFADFRGSLEELVDTLQHGWFYRGQVSISQGQKRGTECLAAAPERFVHCISNHDQTGNHAFGERLAHRIQPTPLRAAEMLLCLSPYTPMLFMGQEWAASTAFLFFCEHNEELGELIRKGRREEFKHFKAFQAPELLEKIPDPQKISTFETSQLVWDELRHERHAQTMALYRECLKLRASSTAFRPEDRSQWQAVELEMGVGVLCLEEEGSAWRVIFDLTGGHRGNLRVPDVFAENASWEVVLSSNESRFGGSATTAVNIKTLEANFSQPETIVLRARKA
jgi:maltooligosyltrehalose trehalohydrolase